MIQNTPPQFRISIAETDDALKAAQRLRYDVFVRELGGSGSMVDHKRELEIDCFDPYVDHMLLHNDSIDAVVGVYRLMRPEMAQRAGQYYSQDEFNLTPLIRSGRRLLELGRSCVHRDYRGGTAMFHLFNGLAQYVSDHKIDVMFGVASFHGTDLAKLEEPLSLLHHRHLAPKALRVKALVNGMQSMDIIPKSDLDRRKAMVQIPALIKAYLRLGGVVGEGAFVDHIFNTTDVCLIMDTADINTRHSRIYTSRVQK